MIDPESATFLCGAFVGAILAAGATSLLILSLL